MKLKYIVKKLEKGWKLTIGIFTDKQAARDTANEINLNDEKADATVRALRDGTYRVDMYQGSLSDIYETSRTYFKEVRETIEA